MSGRRGIAAFAVSVTVAVTGTGLAIAAPSDQGPDLAADPAVQEQLDKERERVAALERRRAQPDQIGGCPIFCV